MLFRSLSSAHWSIMSIKVTARLIALVIRAANFSVAIRRGISLWNTFCLAPTLGLPPELPGTAAADLLQRQTWWITTAASTAVAIALVVFGKHWALKLLGAVILVIPHVVGAPQPMEHSSLAPEALETQFKIASQLTNLVFWLALGAISAWLFSRKPESNYSA